MSRSLRVFAAESYYAHEQAVDAGRPGFSAELAVQLWNLFPGTLTLRGGMTPPYPTAQVGFMYGYYFD